MPEDIQEEYRDKTSFARKYDTPYPLTRDQKTKAIAASVATAPMRYGPLGTLMRGLSNLPGEVGRAAGQISDPGEAVEDYERANPLRQQQIARRARKNYSLSGAGNVGGSYGLPGVVGEGSRREPTRGQLSTNDGNQNVGTSGGGSGGKETGRPSIYFMWDVGVNIPSPSDPTYTLYQQYLAERAASNGVV